MNISASPDLEALARFPVENPHPVMRWGASGEVQYLNGPAERVFAELGIAERGPIPSDWLAAVETAMKDARVVELDVVAGTQLYAFSVTPARGADYVYVYGRDVTRQKEAEAELVAARDAAEAASRTKSAFLANMSHELRTPLNAIIGYSELLLDDALDAQAEILVPDLEKIKSAGKHLLALINDILDFSKIEAGKMELSLGSVPLSLLVEEVQNTVRPLAAERGNDLVVDVDPSLGEIVSDITRIRQVLLNLLSNAVKFTSDGRISLVARREGQGVVIRVEDTGIGMTPRQIERLFQPFTQADVTTTRRFGGTGLGLTISRRIVEMLGGAIEVRSEENRGSCFTVTLPSRPPERDGSQLVPQPSRARTPSVKPIGVRELVLVIDDDPTVVDILSRFLEGEGFDVALAYGGLDGLEKARALRPSAITLDVMMPGMDGWSVLAQLKKDPDLREIPVVMVSIADDKGVGFALGAADYLTKPFDRERLASVIRLHARSAHPKVLVVDDEASARQYLSRVLEKEGAAVIEAGNGREALERALGDQPDLILLDLMMPEMNGFEFVQRLRDDPRGARIPVVVVTAMDLSNEDRARLGGAVERTIAKAGLEPGALVEVVNAVIRGHRRPTEAGD